MIEKLVTNIFTEHNSFDSNEMLTHKGSFLVKSFPLILKFARQTDTTIYCIKYSGWFWKFEKIITDFALNLIK